MDKIKTEVLERFTRYVKIDTESDPTTGKTPSTKKQFDLAKLLVNELNELGVKNVELTDKCYVYGTLPSNLPEGKTAPAFGLITHLDTSPDVSGKNVKPILHENYDGTDIQLPGDSSVSIRVEDNPMLKDFIGDTIITADGTTLLGADDKGGIAIVMSLIAYLNRNPEISHGEIKIGFTPDEEIGCGANHFDVKKFGAEFAYTIDGSSLGEIENETFCADSAILTVKGINVHPGFAKGKMVNSIKVASEIIARLPKEGAPETTENREAYIHPNDMKASVEETTIQFLLRAFDVEGLREKENLLRGIVEEVGAKYPKATCKIEIKEYYRNMRYELDKHPEVTELALESLRKIGVEPKVEIIRGGTDGARLSFMGLPTPNFFAGGQNFHSKQEWVALGVMEKAVQALAELSKLVAEK